MKPGIMPRVFLMSWSVCSYSPIFCFTILVFVRFWVYKIVWFWRF
jgi:hypothetical protein